MNQAILTSCTPWAICLVVAVIAARVLVAVSGAKLDFARIRRVHSNESGSVQSLSFVLTLPFFVMVLMLIVQVNQIMFGNIVVHYAAFAAVRSASVWIPANVGYSDDLLNSETENRIGTIGYRDGIEIPYYSSREGEGQEYVVSQGGSKKYTKILHAAQLACMPLAPSRNLGYELDQDGELALSGMVKSYSALDPASATNVKISDRIKNKLAYAYSNTEISLSFWHRWRPQRVRIGDEIVEFRDPPLWPRVGKPYFPKPEDSLDPNAWQYYFDNEVGWQDELTVLVTFNLPLLPGPIRFFSPTGGSIAPDGTAPSRDKTGNAFIWPLKAFATIGMEGQKPRRRYWQENL